ncbi:hypothetical protein TTHERM_00755980 (macronuclear) [Tetrahymena thermophila SB210]|uniref:Uncharacterized protein n=1 Tax=Tetrahymena thermophila (strain SB210) TaxID=312017 RepID=I7M623_TETTS|nr:hypothetical protein TTHERM_00755980 [Tetrahymena thermophila SB210]EAR84064.1 hypothetical protein TTHERM_00755980 [Tetrahymena thermophila SB210]|eukprot:XP_001031727.1 hypothetical protein TTHERM_00755980 [Tetrahymena thermophila SB210]
MMIISPHNSSYQFNSNINTPSNAQSMLNSQGSQGQIKQKNKLMLAIRPQNEYQVYQNQDSNTPLKDIIFAPQVKKQKINFSQASLNKTSSQGFLNKSNANQGQSLMATDQGENNNNFHFNHQLQKKNSCVGLALPSKTIYGNDKIQSPTQPLTAKAGEQKQNNFYFPSKNSKINKRTIYKFNEKILDSQKKPFQSNGIVLTTENSPKQKLTIPSSQIGTSRLSVDANFEKKQVTLSNFNRLTSFIQKEQVNKLNENSDSNNNSKLSPNGHQQKVQPNNNSSQPSQSLLLVEYRKLQLANYKLQQKVQQLEKQCMEQEEKLLEKDQMLAIYESKSQNGSILQLNSFVSTSKAFQFKQQLNKMPSLIATNSNTVQNTQVDTNVSNNNSFNNDKKNCNSSNAQMSLSLSKSPHSPQRSILHLSTIANAKSLQNHSQSINELISPKPQKNKTKLLSINLHNSDAKDLPKDQFNQFQYSQQPHFSELYSDKLESNFIIHESLLHQISPIKEKQQCGFTFQNGQEEEEKNTRKQQLDDQQLNIQKGLDDLLSRLKKVLASKKAKK